MQRWIWQGGCSEARLMAAATAKCELAGTCLLPPLLSCRHCCAAAAATAELLLRRCCKWCATAANGCHFQQLPACLHPARRCRYYKPAGAHHCSSCVTSMILPLCLPSSAFLWPCSCRYYKPAGAHHCSSCGTCVMGLDHHVRPLQSGFCSRCAITCCSLEPRRGAALLAQAVPTLAMLGICCPA